MIYNLCNIGNEQNDTFYKISIIKKLDVAYFTHLMSDEDLKTVIENLPDSANVINTDLLPENLSVSNINQSNINGQLFRHAISHILTPQDRNLKTLLESYNNEEVIAVVAKHNSTYIYGTSQTPLVFTYQTQYSNQAQGLKGYSIRLRGETIQDYKLLENITVNVFSRGLAFELAGAL